MVQINLITAVAEDFGIGFEGDLPWKLTNELAYFHQMTTQVYTSGKANAVIMGRKTYFSNPKSCRPFIDRFNIVISRETVVDEPGVLTYSSWDEAISKCETLKDENLLETVWVVGGHAIYKMGLESPLCNRIYLTRVYGKFECDTYFPSECLRNFDLIIDPSIPSTLQEENGIQYRFEVYQKKVKG